MAGVEVLGALASATQIVHYVISTTEHLKRAYERAKGRCPDFHRQYNMFKQAACTAEFIQSIPSLQTPLVLRHLEDICECLRELDEILGRAVSEKNSKLWKRFLKEILSGGDMNGAVSKRFAALEASKSSLMLCVLGTYGNALVDLTQRIDPEIPLSRSKDLQTQSFDENRRTSQEILSEVSQVRELLDQSTKAGVCRPRVTDVLHTHGMLGLMQSPTSSSATYADSEQDLEGGVSEKYMKTGTSWEYKEPSSSEYQKCIPYVGGKDRQGCVSLSTRDNGSEFPITVHGRPDSGYSSSTANVHAGSCYSGVRSVDNAIQINGAIGITQSAEIGCHHYSDIVAGGNSRQINGNIHDPALFLSLLER